jgi:EH domain-containing protein 1
MTDFHITAAGTTPTDTDDRTALIATRLKQLYSKSILPVEKKYRYDYFFDSPLLSDVEFDGTI